MHLWSDFISAQHMFLHAGAYIHTHFRHCEFFDAHRICVSALFCRYKFRLNEVIQTNRMCFSVWNPLWMHRSTQNVLDVLGSSICEHEHTPEASARSFVHSLANMLVVKRCNQILCVRVCVCLLDVCGGNIIGKPDHSGVLSAVPVSGRNCNQFSINICYSCAATDWVDFSTKNTGVLGLYLRQLKNQQWWQWVSKRSAVAGIRYAIPKQFEYNNKLKPF